MAKDVNTDLFTGLVQRKTTPTVPSKTAKKKKSWTLEKKKSFSVFLSHSETFTY